MKHWASDLIGRPWSPEGTGPESFNCWNLVRHVYKDQLGLDLPLLQIGKAYNEEALRDLCTTGTWNHVGQYRANNRPRQWDIVLCWCDGLRHVGVMIDCDHQTLLLHCVGGEEMNVGVVLDDLEFASARGFHNFEAWRLN